MEATGFKLFGKNISYSDSGRITTNLPVFSTAVAIESSGGGCDKHGGFTHGDELRMDETCLKEEDSKRERLIEDQLITETKQENNSSPKAISQSDGNVEPPMITENTNVEKTETLGDVTDSQREDLKKPDKTIPCIRCNSMDTKFCYYNNYNVKQPRHFCKSCQRYWTAGGTTRNMAVGAGRRKNKNPPTSHYGFLTVSQSAQIEAPKVISFGPVSPNVDSNGRLSSVSDDCSSGGSTVTTSNSVVVAEKMQDGNRNGNGNGFHSTQQVVVPCINPGVSWSYWNSAVPFPGLCPSGYPPMPFYPSPYWNYIPYVQPSYDQNNAFTLGKRSREAESININPNGGCSEEEVKKQKVSVLIPKTLRINDPDEAAKSSIWSTLGINNESLGTQQGVFNAFQTKHNEESVNRSVLHVNPAALSRSLCFQERA